MEPQHAIHSRALPCINASGACAVKHNWPGGAAAGSEPTGGTAAAAESAAAPAVPKVGTAGSAAAAAGRGERDSWQCYLERVRGDLAAIGCDVRGAPPAPAAAVAAAAPAVGGGGGEGALAPSQQGTPVEPPKVQAAVADGDLGW
jgi:hypothetical protein